MTNASMIAVAGLWAMALGCAVMAGVYFAFSAFVMRSLDAMPKAEGMAAMQSINRKILASLFMPVFFATSIASIGLAVWGIAHRGEPEAVFLISGGVLYFVGMFVCTAARNVPLNDRLDAVEPTTREATTLWSDYVREWTRWNHVRTASAGAASALFLAAATLM